MMADYGTRPVTKRDRDIAVKRDLINSTSNVHITPGMRRALARRPSVMLVVWRHVCWCAAWLFGEMRKMER